MYFNNYIAQQVDRYSTKQLKNTNTKKYTQGFMYRTENKHGDILCSIAQISYNFEHKYFCHNVKYIIIVFSVKQHLFISEFSNN